MTDTAALKRAQTAYWESKVLTETSPDRLASACRAYAAALSLHLAQDGWQPIETAPRTGERILICGGTVLYGGEGCPEHRPFTETEIVCWRDGWHGGYGSEYDGEYWHRPTHWQPIPNPHLPSAPSIKGGE